MGVNLIRQVFVFYLINSLLLLGYYTIRWSTEGSKKIGQNKMKKGVRNAKLKVSTTSLIDWALCSIYRGWTYGKIMNFWRENQLTGGAQSNKNVLDWPSLHKMAELEWISLNFWQIWLAFNASHNDSVDREIGSIERATWHKIHGLDGLAWLTDA